MLIIPDHEGESVREFAERLRLWNPRLDPKAARHVAANFLRGQYNRTYLKPHNAPKAKEAHAGQ